MSDQSPATGIASQNVTPPRAPRSRIGWFLGVGLLMLLVIGGVVYWQQQAGIEPAPAAQMMPPPEVTVATPVYQEITEWDEYTGQFSAVDFVEMRPRVSGYIESVHFKDGQLVKAGDLLYIIDPRPFEIALASAQAQLENATAQRQLGQAQLARAGSLRKNDFVAASTYDAELRSAEAAVETANAAIRSAQLDLEWTHVTAPISGRIGRNAVTEGNLVAGGSGGNATLLATIVTLDPIYLDFDMSESDFLAYQRASAAGLMKSTRDTAVPVFARLFDEDDWPLKGNLDFVDNRVARDAGTIRARAVFANPNALITPGQFGRVRIPGSEPYKAILIPDSAIVADQSRKIVLTVGADGKVVPKIIRPGPFNDELGLRIVREGLDPADRIVINGLMRARPGAQVTPVSGKIEPMPGTPAGSS